MSFGIMAEIKIGRSDVWGIKRMRNSKAPIFIEKCFQGLGVMTEALSE
jgi:hypothetical protein